MSEATKPTGGIAARRNPNPTVRLTRFGGVDEISVEAMPMPALKHDDVLVRVAAASVNPADCEIRKGEFTEAVTIEDLPTSLGYDLAGTVQALGPGNDAFRQGDRVFAFVANHNGQGHFVAAKNGEVAPAPSTIDLVHAAAVPLAAMTAWQGLFDKGRLKAGDTVLIHGGAGGVGHFAVQLAKARGATVFTTCSGRDLDFVRGLGADMAIDYREQRFEELAYGVDLVFDLVGGDTNKRSYHVLREGGILVSTIEAPDEQAARESKVRATIYMAEPDADQLREIAGMIDSGAVKVEIARTFPLEQVRDAQQLLENGHVRGKVVLTMEPATGQD